MACPTIVEYSQQEGFYRVPLPAARQTHNLEDQWFRTFQLPPPGVPHVWIDASEPQQRKVDLWARNGREFDRKWRLPRHFWVLLHAVNLWHGTNGFTSPLKEGAVRIFLPEKSDGFGGVWTREFGYQRPARLPLDHRSHFSNDTIDSILRHQEVGVAEDLTAPPRISDTIRFFFQYGTWTNIFISAVFWSSCSYLFTHHWQYEV